MNKAEFMSRLKRGLARLRPQMAADILADYESHFADAMADGRTEQEVANALGDPGRLAKEIRAEAGLKRWEEERNASAAIAAVVAVIGLGALDVIILVPILLAVSGILIGLFAIGVAVFIAGGTILVFGPLAHPPGGPFAAILGGFGMMAASIGVIALLVLATVGLVNAVVWFGRLHYQILKPALPGAEEQ